MEYQTSQTCFKPISRPIKPIKSRLAVFSGFTIFLAQIGGGKFAVKNVKKAISNCRMDILYIPQNVDTAKYEPLSIYSICCLIPTLHTIGVCNESTWDLNRN